MDLLEHGIRVANLSMKIKKSKKLWIASSMHDIGKIGMSSIVNLKRKLTEKERKLIQNHSQKGFCLLNKFNPEIATIVLHHHENYDGSGYPSGLKGQNIPFESRVIRIVDVYDALTNERPYKRRFTKKEALEIMIKEEKNFDPLLFQEFLRIQNEEVLQSFISKLPLQLIEGGRNDVK